MCRFWGFLCRFPGVVGVDPSGGVLGVVVCWRGVGVVCGWCAVYVC